MYVSYHFPHSGSFHAIPVDRSSSDPSSSDQVAMSLQPTIVKRVVSSHQPFDGAEEKDAASAKANRDHGHRRMNSYDQAVSMDTITEHSSSSPVRDDTPPPHVPDPHDTETEAESPQEHHSLTNNRNLTLDELTPGRSDEVSLPPKLLKELRLPKKLSELSFAEGKDFQRKYRGHWVFVTVITLFYAIPAFQLMLTYQQVHTCYCYLHIKVPCIVSFALWIIPNHCFYHVIVPKP